jgi:diguanylate cyclase (GGDEF)-like protein
VLVTAKTDTASRVEGLRIGADDYVCKPFEEAELLARVTTMLRIKRLHDQVTQQKARFERLSVHDELTGLYNFRFLHTRLNEEFKRAERYHEPFACLLVDIDQLRAVNDAGGRPAGDVAIRRVADAIRRCVREVDVVARYGGEEFLVVLPSTHFAGSVVVAERVWREVGVTPTRASGPQAGSGPARAEPAEADSDRRSTLPGGGVDDTNPSLNLAIASGEVPRTVTVSIGVALYPSRDVRTKDALLRAAEAALSQAKREGGNRICVFQQQGFIYSPSFSTARADDGAAGGSMGRAPLEPALKPALTSREALAAGRTAQEGPASTRFSRAAPEAPASSRPPRVAPAAAAPVPLGPPAERPQDGPPSTRAPRTSQDGPPSTRAPRTSQEGPPSTRAPRTSQEGPPSTRAPRPPQDAPSSSRSWRPGPDSEGGRRGA